MEALESTPDVWKSSTKKMVGRLKDLPSQMVDPERHSYALFRIEELKEDGTVSRAIHANCTAFEYLDPKDELYRVAGCTMPKSLLIDWDECIANSNSTNDLVEKIDSFLMEHGNGYGINSKGKGAKPAVRRSCY